jgi:HlyD family secretion protein
MVSLKVASEGVATPLNHRVQSSMMRIYNVLYWVKPMTQSLPKPQYPQSDSITKPRWSTNLRWLIPLGLVFIGAGAATWYWLSRPEANELELSGRIEGYETDIGNKVAGRVQLVTVREGDEVRQGEVLVQLDDAELQARLRAATAQLVSAQQNVENANLQIDVLESQIREIQLTRQQAQGDAQGRISQAGATVATAEAQLAEAQAQAVQARSQATLAQADLERFSQLFREGAIPRQQLDQARTTFETTAATLKSREAAVEAARRQVVAAQGGLTQAQSTDLNPDIRTAQIDRLNKQLAQARAQLGSAQADAKRAEAQRQEIIAQKDDLRILSPISGVVVTRNAEPGEVLASGTTVLTLLNLNTVYLRGYIPEGEIGRVRVGQSARIYLDSAPKQALTAQVNAIDPEASFTPENIYFRQDRVKQVFGVKLAIENPAGFAKPGMPADAEIITEAETAQSDSRRK